MGVWKGVLYTQTANDKSNYISKYDNLKSFGPFRKVIFILHFSVGYWIGIVGGILSAMLVMYFCIVICCCKGKEDSNSATRLEDASKIKEGVAPDENSLPERDQTNSNEFSK